MWSRAWSEHVPACPPVLGRSPAGDGAPSARAMARLYLTLALGALVLAQLGACSSTPQRSKAPAPPPASSAAAAGKANAAAGKANAAAGTTAETPGAPSAAHPEVTPAARADFDRAVQYMRSGNATEAELGFKQVAVQYPQYSAPLVNLAIMQR